MVIKYADESEEEHEVRIQFMKVLLPKLSIWTDNKYKQYVSTSTATRSSSASTESSTATTTTTTSTTTTTKAVSEVIN